MARAKLVKARETFSTDVDGASVVVHAGTVVRATDPRVKGREDLFEPAEQRPDIEQATAAPGEKRGRRR